MDSLLIASNNPGKRREYSQILADVPLILRTPQELNLQLQVREDGATYLENARLKALRFQQESGLPTLADDSGLEVDVLGGKPGLHSARLGGPGTDDTARCHLLLAQLQGVPWEERTARFRCVMVLANERGELYSAEGTCEGIITFEPKGTQGFGYDPVFYLPKYQVTMAELDPSTKNRISHRAHAAQGIRPFLASLLAEQDIAGERD